MDKKNLFFFLLFVFQITLANLNAKEEQIMQIIANKIDQNGSIITATGDILVFSPHYFITAQKAIYDKNSSTMNLYGNVNISKDKESVTLTQYAFLDMKNEINNANPILLIDKSTNVWINALSIDKQKDLHQIKNATLSSCDCINPAWSIGFSSGDYNSTDKWINTYNNTLYINEIPAWYFLIPAIPYAPLPSLAMSYLLVKMPYMGFSTNKERRSGLLRPQLGYGQKDGLLYAQPIYYAPTADFDFEYIPQIRTSRGNGHEFIARYVDSRYSKLEIDYGLFNENNDYFKEEKLANKVHNGWNIKYNRSKLFSNQNNNDGLYLYLQDMKDVEYLNTKYDSENQILYADKILESKIKYYYDTQLYHLNSEIIEYNNISYDTNGKENDDKETMQMRPSVNLHRYSDSIFLDNFRSSFDFKYKNQIREVGLGVQSSEIALPFRFTHNLFDNYLLFSYDKSFYFHNLKYSNNENDYYKDGNYLTTNDSISLETDLLKAYDTKIHTINFGLRYGIPRTIKKDGDIYNITNNDTNLSIFPTTTDLKNLNISFNQSLFNKENLSSLINHKINQKIVFDDNGTSTLENLENEISIHIPYTVFSNRFLFNHDEKIIISSASSLNFSKDNYFTNLDYSYSYDKNTTTNLYKNGPENEAITGHIGTKVLKYYTLGYKEQYDLVNDISKFKEYKLKIDKKCWSLDLSMQDSLVASATTTANARRQNIIYATITLKPIISFAQKFIQNEREE